MLYFWLMKNNLIEQIITIAGSQTALAEGLGVSQTLVWKWLHGKAKVTPEHVIPLEKISNGEVSRSQLRPDLYPVEVSA